MPGLESDLEEWQTQEANATQGEAEGDIGLMLIHVFHIHKSCFQLKNAIASGPRRNPNLGMYKTYIPDFAVTVSKEHTFFALKVSLKI